MKQQLYEKMESLFSDIEAFASYSFNLGHSASYGHISYYTAYLKAHYPLEFLCACLQCEGTDPDNATKYIRDCERHGIKVCRHTLMNLVLTLLL